MKEDERNQAVGTGSPSAEDDPVGKGTRDYLAIGVVAAAILVLFVSAYFAVNQLRLGTVLIHGRVIAEWVEDLDHYGREFLARIPGGMVSRGDPAKDAQRHLSRAYQFYTRNRLDEALSECTKAIQLNPRNPQGHYWRGRVQIKLGKYEPALVDFQRAVRLKPDYREAHDNLGWLYERQNQNEEALAHLNRSIELARDNAWAYYHRAVVLYRTGQTARALEDARKACELKNRDGCRLYEEYRKMSGKT